MSTSRTVPDTVIDLLVTARRGGSAAALPAGLDVDRLEDAYSIQHGVAQAMGWFTGVPQYWKSGGASREALQTHAPLPPAGVVASPADLSRQSFRHCRVEIEVALRLAVAVDRDRAATLDGASAASLVDAMCVSIEIVDSRWHDGLNAAPMSKLADLQAHGALVLGPWVPWQARDWTQQRCDVGIGKEPSQKFLGTHSMADPVYVLPRWLQHVTARYNVVPAGTVVTTGSWCGMLPALAGDRVQVRFDGIGEAQVNL